MNTTPGGKAFHLLLPIGICFCNLQGDHCVYFIDFSVQIQSRWSTSPIGVVPTTLTVDAIASPSTAAEHVYLRGTPPVIFPATCRCTVWAGLPRSSSTILAGVFCQPTFHRTIETFHGIFTLIWISAPLLALRGATAFTRMCTHLHRNRTIAIRGMPVVL